MYCDDTIKRGGREGYALFVHVYTSVSGDWPDVFM